jgi:hypothetical protein
MNEAQFKPGWLKGFLQAVQQEIERLPDADEQPKPIGVNRVGPYWDRVGMIVHGHAAGRREYTVTVTPGPERTVTQAETLAERIREFLDEQDGL